MKKSSNKKFLKKIKKCRLAVNIAAITLVVAFTVYNMIPKDEKINEVEAQKLADSLSKRIINNKTM